MAEPASIPPALEGQVILTWLKRDLAEAMAESYHEDLLRLRGCDDQAFKSTLARYAGWSQYVTALNEQLTQMHCQEPFTEEPVAVYYPVSNPELQKMAENELNSEGDTFVKQWSAVLLPAYGSWVQRVQPATADGQSIPL
jgi:hypothetical protein